MNWADWMIVTKTLEEELELERTVRNVKNCTDENALKELCVSLIKTHWHQTKMLKQVVGYVGELDAANLRQG